MYPPLLAAVVENVAAELVVSAVVEHFDLRWAEEILLDAVGEEKPLRQTHLPVVAT